MTRERSWPGFTALVNVDMHEPAEGAPSGRHYAFDLCTSERDGLGFYTVGQDHAVLELRSGAETYPLEVSIGPAGIPLAAREEVLAEVGQTERATFLRLRVNGRVVGSRTIPFRVAVPQPRGFSSTLFNGGCRASSYGSLLVGLFMLFSGTATDEGVQQLTAQHLGTWVPADEPMPAS